MNLLLIFSLLFMLFGIFLLFQAEDEKWTDEVNEVKQFCVLALQENG